jgi:hypothetical protein
VNLVTNVVEREHAIKKHQYAVGKVEVIAAVFGNFFQLPDDVIRKISNGAAGKWRQSGDSRRLVFIQQLTNSRKDVANPILGLFASLNHYLITVAGDHHVRTHAEKRVSSNFFSTLDRFQQEGVWLALRDAEER